jgi:hypothetical protein
MVRKAKNMIWWLLRKINLGGPIQLMLNGALIEDGWYKSYNTKTSVDKNGNPVPWCTYPFIKFIETRLKNNFNVFEFGCGNSTLWYASRVGYIKCVEHNKEWFDNISQKLPENASAVFREIENGGSYSKEVLKERMKYDIIIIDGRDRVNCIFNSVDALADNGTIILDNSDRLQYKEGIAYLIDKGFRKIDLIGMSPVTSHNNHTSIFYRDNNCLNI